MKSFVVGFLLTCSIAAGSVASAHVPVLLPPLEATPFASYFIDRSEISHAVYSELTHPDTLFIAQLEVKPRTPTTIQMLTPVCRNLPRYQAFQPGVLVIPGQVPWAQQGETHARYVARLRRMAIHDITSNYPPGQRPTFYEPFGKVTYWVGGQWRGRLAPGLYSLVVYSPDRSTGTFSLGINEKEEWTPDRLRYAASVVPTINAGLCAPGGFTGHLGP